MLTILSDKAGAALKPDSQKSYLEQGTDMLKGKADVRSTLLSFVLVADQVLLLPRYPPPCHVLPATISYSPPFPSTVRRLYRSTREPEVFHPTSR